MTNVIAFPGLGLEFVINRVALSLGPITVYWYGVIIAIGFALAVWYAMNKIKTIGLKSDDLIDLLLFAVPISIIGARAYYVLFNYDKLYYYDHASMYKIWDGGLAIYGGLIAAVLTGVIFALIKGIRIGVLLDLGAMGFLIGQSIGRWGNFMNAEAYGSAASSFLRMEITNLATMTATGAVHPTFLYESLWNALGFLLLHLYFNKRKMNGEIFVYYVMWYGFGRGIIEGLRADSLYLLDTQLRVSQVFAFLSCLVALGVFIYMMLFVEKENRIVGSPYYETKLMKRKAAKLAEKEAAVLAAAEAAAQAELAQETEEECVCEAEADKTEVETAQEKE